MNNRTFACLAITACIFLIILPETAHGQESDENVSFNMTGGLTITNVSPGQEVDVLSPVTFTYTAPVENMVFSIHPVPPINTAGGYEEIPDQNWVKLDKVEVVAESGVHENVWITLEIPNDESYLGKNWEVWIDVDPQTENQLWGLGGYCRLWISITTTAPPPTWPIILIIAVIGGVIGVLAYAVRKEKI